MPAGIIGTVGRTTSVTETFQNGVAKPATAQLTSGRSTCGQLPQAWNLLTEVVGCCKTLTGEAFEKLGNVDPVSLKCEDSIEKFKQRIVEVYEPSEDYRIGKIMDSFLDGFTRKHDQEIMDYSLAWAREVYKVEKVAGELTDKWKAHLSLTEMRLTSLQKSQVLTGALGTYTVEGLQKAALTKFPSMKDAFAKREKTNDSRGYTHRHARKPTGRPNGGRRLFGRKPWKANEAHVDDEAEDEGSESEQDWEHNDEGEAEEDDEVECEECYELGQALGDA